jgi:hypothetical protein
VFDFLSGHGRRWMTSDGELRHGSIVELLRATGNGYQMRIWPAVLCSPAWGRLRGRAPRGTLWS